MHPGRVFTRENISALRVGVIYWFEIDELALRLSQTLTHLGCEVIDLAYGTQLPQGLDVVLVIGPFGSLVPIANQLLAYSPAQRPAFVLLMTEQLPDPGLPEWVRYGLGLLRSRIERLAFSQQKNQVEWQINNPWWHWVTLKGFRFRYYGDLYWLQREGLLSVLAVTSHWTAGYLRARGFDPVALPLSYEPGWGADLKLDRDIPVLWLGKTATARRRRLLRRIRAELKMHGVELMVIDGVENPYIFGEARTILLNRTKIVLNLLREKWDDNSMRYFLAGYNRALIVTEPTLPHTPFLPGVHLVEASPEQMVETICYYLAHEAERQRIVELAHHLLTQASTRGKGMAQILERVIAQKQGH